MTLEQTLQEVLSAADWTARAQAIRRVPEVHGTAEHASVYARIAQELYAPALSPQFAFIPWPASFELEGFLAAYEEASELTNEFRNVSAHDIVAAISQSPRTLLIFRTIVGYTSNELAVAVSEATESEESGRVSAQRLKAIEGGATPSADLAHQISIAIDRLVRGELWSTSPEPTLRRRLDKPDTAEGWDSVQSMAESGVPFGVFLHQRHYGGSFRQLLDATSSIRGQLLEDQVEELLASGGVPFIRTGSHNQGDIAERFGLTVRPAPDFVVHDDRDNLKAIIECKQANDGGTARDKASRFRALRQEATRIGGIAVIAVVDGLGWERVGDALGPVVRDTDGLTFTLSTLSELTTVEPLASLATTDRSSASD